MAGAKRKAADKDTPTAVLLEMIQLADDGRCMACGWPLESSSMKRGCVIGNCSFRPQDYEAPYRRWMERTRILVLARKTVPEVVRAKHSA